MRIPVPVLFQDAKGTVLGISPYDYAAWTSILNNKEVVASEALKGIEGGHRQGALGCRENRSSSPYCDRESRLGSA